MKLHQASARSQTLISAFQPGVVTIGQTAHQGNLIITPDTVQPWRVERFEDLQPEHFTALLALAPEVVLFGSGPRLRHLHPRVTSALTEAQIGLEVMDTQAACRSFNILLAEDRKVVLVLLNSAG